MGQKLDIVAPRVAGSVAACLLLLYPIAAFGNVGLPMLLVVWPGLGILFPAIVSVEAIVGHRRINRGWRTALKATLVANLVSSIVGIPLTWLVLVFAEFALSLPLSLLSPEGTAGSVVWAVITSPWLPPFDYDAPGSSWRWLLAATVLCVPFFFASVWVEAKVLKRLLPDLPEDRVRAWSWRVNVASYAIIVSFLAVATMWTAYVV